MAGRSGVDHSGTGHASRNQTVLKTTTNSENGRSQDRNGHSENVIHSENGRHRSRRGGVNPRCEAVGGAIDGAAAGGCDTTDTGSKWPLQEVTGSRARGTL
jgi:hypothetical protein